MFDQSPVFEAPRPLQQHENFIAAVNAVGGEARSIGPNDSVVLRRRIMGLPVAMLPRLTDCQAFTAGAKRHLRAAGLSRHLILIAPDAPCPELARLGAIPVMTPATVAELDLTPPPHVRRSAMHKKWRNRLHKAERAGLRVSIRPVPTDRMHRLLVRDDAQAKARGYRNWPQALTLAYAAQNPSQTVLFTASHGRTRLAEVLVLVHGSVATYHIGQITTDGKERCAHNLLMDHAASWLAERGVKRFDLGLIDEVHAPGLARFKLGMGATRRRLGGTWGWWPVLGRSLGGLAALDKARM